MGPDLGRRLSIRQVSEGMVAYKIEAMLEGLVEASTVYSLSKPPFRTNRLVYVVRETSSGYLES